MKRQMENLRWREVVWRRPFGVEAVWELLAHLAALSPRGAVLWEARGCGGHVRYYLGADHRFLDKIEETCCAHGDIAFYDTPDHVRKPVGVAKRLRITKPTLSLNTGVSMSAIRAGLAAMPPNLTPWTL